jgi:glutaredoxin
MKILLWALLLAAPAAAAVYTWTDRDGVVHYADSPEKAPKGAKVRPVSSNRVSAYDGSSAPVGGKLSMLQGVAASSGVEMFVTSWCPACRKAREGLRSRGIPYSEYDIESDPSALARAKSLGYAGAIPFFVVNGRSRTGYSQAWIDAALSAR